MLKNIFVDDLFGNQHKFETQHISLFVKNNENVVKTECFSKNFSEGEHKVFLFSENKGEEEKFFA